MSSKPKSKSNMLFGFLRGCKGWFLLAVLFGLLRTVCAMLNPQIIRFTVDSVIGTKESKLPAVITDLIADAGGRLWMREHLYLIALLVVALAACAAVFRYCFVVFNTRGGESFVRAMRDGTYRHIQGLPFQWHMEHQTGDIIQRCTTDIEMIKNFLSEQLSEFINCVITLTVCLFFMYTVNWRLALIPTIALPVLVGYSVLFRAKIAGQFRTCDENEGALSSVAQENLTGVRVVRAFGRESYEQARFDAQSQKVRNSWVRLGRYLTAFWESNSLLTGIQTMLILVIGTRMVVHGELTTGDLLALISYNAMTTAPIRGLGRTISEMSKAGVSISRIYEIMQAEEETDPPEALTPPMDGDIVFEHVSFSYPNCPPVLEDIHLTIPAGTTLGILGGTGSGKSTLMHLLNRLYDLPPEWGRITVGGVDLADMKRDWIRSNVGMVLQEPMLFSRTLKDNLLLVSPEADESDLTDAVETACLDEAIEKFAEGYDTIVGERGVTLSGGQKQRAAIARMLLQKTPIIVFDDSLSAVDAETDAKIRRALREKMEGVTSILISHRISTLMQAQQILVLDHGRIAQLGTHQELIAQEGLYKQIYQVQLAPQEVNGHE